MDSLLTQLGVGGIFALLIIKEVFNFLAKRKTNGNASGERPVEYWAVAIRSFVAQELSEKVVPDLIENRRIMQQIHDDLIRLSTKLDSLHKS